MFFGFAPFGFGGFPTTVAGGTGFVVPSTTVATAPGFGGFAPFGFGGFGGPFGFGGFGGPFGFGGFGPFGFGGVPATVFGTQFLGVPNVFTGTAPFGVI